MSLINEGKLNIEFSDEKWQIEKYDECNVFINNIGQTNNLKAIDIIGVHNFQTLYFFEVKDFSDNEEFNLEKWDYRIDMLTNNLSQKIKDSLVGILSIQRNDLLKNNFWNLIVKLFNENNEFKIVFWLDGNLSNYSRNFRLCQINNNLKRKLQCLNAKILVTNSDKANLIDSIHKYE